MTADYEATSEKLAAASNELAAVQDHLQEKMEDRAGRGGAGRGGCIPRQWNITVKRAPGGGPVATPCTAHLLFLAVDKLVQVSLAVQLLHMFTGLYTSTSTARSAEGSRSSADRNIPTRRRSRASLI